MVDTCFFGYIAHPVPWMKQESYFLEKKKIINTFMTWEQKDTSQFFQTTLIVASPNF